MEKKIRLTREDINSINEVIAKFPEVDMFYLHEHGHSGIGCLLNLDFETDVNNLKASVSVPIADETTW
jgi:hypothetical protein